MCPHFSFRRILPVLSIALLSGLSAEVFAQDRIVSVDSTLSLILPLSFEATRFDPASDLQFMDAETETVVMIMWRDSSMLVEGDLEQRVELAAGDIASVIENSQIVGPESLTIGGLPAVQYVIYGSLEGTTVVYLVVLINGESNFAMVFAANQALESELNETILRDIAGSVELAPYRPGVSMDVYDIVEGTWAWSHDEDSCFGLTQRIEFSEDRASMTIHFNEPVESTTGELTTETHYVIEGSGPGILHTYIPGESRLTDEGVPVKWDLMVVARNRFVWRSTDWPEDAYTGMMRRCETNLSETTSESIFRYVDLGLLGRFELGEPFGHFVRLAIEESPLTYRLREGVFGGAESIIVTTDENGIVRLISFEYGTGYDWSEKLTNYVAFLGQPTHSNETEAVWDDGQTEFSLTRIADTPHAAGAVLRDIQATP